MITLSPLAEAIYETLTSRYLAHDQIRFTWELAKKVEGQPRSVNCRVTDYETSYTFKYQVCADLLSPNQIRHVGEALYQYRYVMVYPLILPEPESSVFLEKLHSFFCQHSLSHNTEEDRPDRAALQESLSERYLSPYMAGLGKQVTG
jgi:hypothetical protein